MFWNNVRHFCESWLQNQIDGKHSFEQNFALRRTQPDQCFALTNLGKEALNIRTGEINSISCSINPSSSKIESVVKFMRNDNR